MGTTTNEKEAPQRAPNAYTLPTYPWQKVGTDLFVLNGDTYLLISDYFSRFPEVIKLNTVTSQSVIFALKSVFSRYGIPEELVSDNGPQYASQEFSTFSKEYNFHQTTSRPQAAHIFRKVMNMLSEQYKQSRNY